MIAGGRYDGLIESLGGPHTPAVGWAAGIERLGMLIETPAQPLKVIVVAELVDDEEIGRFVLGKLRRAGFAADMPLKEAHSKDFDRAKKAGADAILVITGRSDGTSSFANLQLKPIAPKDDAMRRLRLHLIECLGQSFFVEPFLMHGTAETTLEWNLEPNSR